MTPEELEYARQRAASYRGNPSPLGQVQASQATSNGQSVTSQDKSSNGFGFDKETGKWISTGAGLLGKVLNADPNIMKGVNPLIAAMSGDYGGAARQVGGIAAGTALKEIGLPGPFIGPAVSTIVGTFAGDSPRKIAENAVNSAVGGVASMLGPIGSIGYSLARMGGLNVAQGAGEGMGMYPEVPTGTEGGYWGKRGRGYDEAGRFMSGNKSFSPYGGAAYDEQAQNKVFETAGNENYSRYGGMSNAEAQQEAQQLAEQQAYEQYVQQQQQEQAQAAAQQEYAKQQELAQQQAAADAYERQLAQQQAPALSGNYSSSGGGWGTNANYSSSGNSNYSPYGGASYSESSDSGGE